MNVRTVLQITFLEFFEALLGCAEVKNTHGVGTAQPRQCDLGYHETTSEDQMKNSPIMIQLASPQVSDDVQEMIWLSQLHFDTSVHEMFTELS